MLRSLTAAVESYTIPTIYRRHKPCCTVGGFENTECPRYINSLSANFNLVNAFHLKHEQITTGNNLVKLYCESLNSKMIGCDGSRISLQKILRFNQHHTINAPVKFDASMHHRMSQMPTTFPPSMVQEARDTLHVADSIIDGVIFIIWCFK